MLQAFVRESGGMAQVFASRDSAEGAASLQRAMDGRDFDYEVRPRERGGFMVARLRRDGTFESWLEE